MKKTLAIIMTAAMVLGLCACGSSAGGSSAASSSAAATSAASSAAEPAAASSSAASAETSEASAAEPSGEAEFVFSYASNDGEDSLRHIYLEQPFMDYITEHSNGRIQFNYFPGGSLARSGAILQGCKDGTVDVGMDVASMYPGSYLYTELLGMPGINLGSTWEEQQANLSTFNEEYVKGEFESDAVVVANFNSLPMYVITNKEINGVSDFGQENIMTSANYFPIFTSLGCSTSPVNYEEAYESIKLGVVDMVHCGFGIINNFRLYEVSKYAYSFPYGVTNSMLFISHNAFDSLPEDLQQVVLDAGKELETTFNTEFKAQNEALVGPKVEEENPDFTWTEFPDEVKTAISDGSVDILAEKVKELNDAGLDGDGALELLKSFAK